MFFFSMNQRLFFSEKEISLYSLLSIKYSLNLLSTRKCGKRALEFYAEATTCLFEENSQKYKGGKIKANNV